MRRKFLFTFLLVPLCLCCQAGVSSQQQQRTSPATGSVAAAEANAASVELQPAPNSQSSANTKEKERRLEKALTARARKIFEQADKLEVMALARSGAPPLDGEKIDVGRMWPFPVYGRIEVVDKRLRAQVVKSLFDGVAEGASTAMCFDPHHAIRATKNDEKIELAICFVCHNFYGIALGDKISGSISNAPKELLDIILASAGAQAK